MVKVMAINAGSSSLKFQLINMPSEEVITFGIVERIGLEQGNFEMKYNGEKYTKECPIKDHSVAVQLLLEALVDQKVVNSLDEIDACGHRIVHGGEYFSDSVKVDDVVVRKVEELAELAPLHNPAHIIGYNAFKEALPGVEHVFVFDTAFHQTLDRERYLYPLPLEYYEDLKVRKYGAHGTSHKYVSQVANEMLGNPKHSRIIVCHLGNGASISAVQDGVCIDTSMGFTPLAGVMMGTRCGDVDPSIMPYLCKKLNKTPDEVLDIYNKKSGMLGISGISSDSRDIENALFKDGDERALLTSLLYARIVSKYIGSYFVEMGGVDAIAFTAGVGENAAYLRRLIIDNISRALGAFLDEKANEVRSKENRVISNQFSQVEVYVIPTNEEVMIARDTVNILGL
ncbi:acetate kinase [[Clostridium] saccharogumia]|uniref:acetate/propionate family kinase n=1 Tax=Thomasclavelia saccharogumia TaxID=341225 RepID=UPI001D077FF4|nr:acetate kinase [Thomasclavelia saccharogumia]MCB6704988.1 acetate kinase [Thomasclavelia saccharogumia]